MGRPGAKIISESGIKGGAVAAAGVQEYLAHKKAPPPKGLHRALGVVPTVGSYGAPVSVNVSRECQRRSRSVYMGTSLIRPVHASDP